MGVVNVQGVCESDFDDWISSDIEDSRHEVHPNPGRTIQQ